MKIPFGKYEDEEIEEVPAHYLLWLIDQSWTAEKYPEIAEWIEENREELEAKKWKD